MANGNREDFIEGSIVCPHMARVWTTFGKGLGWSFVQDTEARVKLKRPSRECPSQALFGDHGIEYWSPQFGLSNHGSPFFFIHDVLKFLEIGNEYGNMQAVI